MVVKEYGDSSEQGIVNMTTHEQKERSSTKPNSGVGDGSANEIDNAEHMEGMEKGPEPVAKSGSQKWECAGAENLPRAKMLCIATPDPVEIPNFGK